jgi:hypothetical protein
MTGSWLHKILVVLVFIFLVAACAGPSVKRTEVDETIDLSGKWNDTDSRLVAEEMILDCLERPWLQRYETSHSGKTPAVIYQGPGACPDQFRSGGIRGLQG